MATVLYDPTKELPFARDGGRIFILEDKTSVSISPGTNDIPEKALTELQKDDFFKTLIENKAIVLNAQPTPEPVVQPQPEIPPPSAELKAAKSLRSP